MNSKLSKVKNLSEENHLSFLKQKSLDLWAREIKKEDIPDICFLIQSKNIISLNIGNNSLGDEGIQLLCEGLKRLSLIYLNLIGNSITDIGASYVGQLLARNMYLQTILLDNNQISNKGAEELLWGIENNYSIKEIKLGNNRMMKNTTEIMKRIDQKLTENKGKSFEFREGSTDSISWETIKKLDTLQVLRLQKCKLTASNFNLEGFLPYLRILDLSDNELNDTFIKSLSSILKCHLKLNHINLKGNPITTHVLSEITSLLHYNFSLITFDVSDRDLSQEINKLLDIIQKFQELHSKINEEAMNACLNSYSNSIFHEVLCKFFLFNTHPLLRKVISERDFDLQHKNFEGNTYLHLAVMQGRFEEAGLLLERGIDLNILNNANQSCKDLAIGKCKSLFEDISLLKVVVVGKGKVGKTTLVNRILEQRNSTLERAMDFISSSRTEGIQAHKWKAGANNQIQIWDFAGQDLFYTTHQFFLSQNSVNLILFDVKDQDIETELIFWLNSIQYRAPGSKVIIVGTCIDKLESKHMHETIIKLSDKIKNKFQEIISYINPEQQIELVSCNFWELNQKLNQKCTEKLSFFPISGKEGWNVKYLESIIKGYSYNTLVRKEFVQLIERIEKLRETRKQEGNPPVLSREEFMDVMKNIFQQNLSEDYDLHLKKLHDLGYILDFGMRHIIIHPQWLSEVFQSVVSIKNVDLIKDGLIPRSKIVQNLKKSFPSQLSAKHSESTSSKEKPKSHSFSISESIVSIGRISLDEDTLMKVSNFNAIQQVVEQERRELNDIFEFLVELMENFQVCVPKPQAESKNKDIDIIVPCVLKSEIIPEVKNFFKSGHQKRILGRKYSFKFIPKGIFEVLFSRLAMFIGYNMKFWKNGLAVTVEQSYLMLEFRDNRDIQIRSTGELSSYLIAAFDFAIRELIEKDYPLVWEHLTIEVEYEFDYQSIIRLWKDYKKNYETNPQIQERLGEILIPWEMLIPELCLKDRPHAQRINDLTRFTAGRILGEGTYAQVYCCRFLDKTETFYAIKRFKFSDKFEKVRESFKKELLIKDLSHPNLTKILDYTENGNNLCIVFPLYDDSLSGVQDKLKASLPPSIKPPNENYWWKLTEIVFYATEILKGLDHLHSNQIAHLDIKAENILVNLKKKKKDILANNNRFEIQSLHIHDFGTLEEVKTKKTISHFVGSKHNMAPEVKYFEPHGSFKHKLGKDFKGGEYDPLKADIFSFGILLGYICFDIECIDQYHYIQHANGHKFEGIIKKCLCIIPTERPNAKELLNYFQTLDLNCNY